MIRNVLIVDETVISEVLRGESVMGFSRMYKTSSPRGQV